LTARNGPSRAGEVSTRCELVLAHAPRSGDPDNGTEAVDPVESHRRPGVGSVDHETVAHEHADVADVSRSGPEEDQIARHHRLSGAHRRTGVVLALGHTGKADAGFVIDSLHQARAVESLSRFAAPHVGDAKEGHDVVHCGSLGGRLARSPHANRSIADQVATDASRRSAGEPTR
jgi:hypothetical protein